MFVSRTPLIYILYNTIYSSGKNALDLVGMGLSKLLIFVLFYKGLITFISNKNLI